MNKVKIVRPLLKEGKRCPFCDSKKIYLICDQRNIEQFTYYVLCEFCNATTGNHESERQAILKWNTRAIENYL